jgi:hypothetical protein
VIDEREVIERAVRLLQPEEPALGRMFRRRDRKRRNRRLGAGVVAIVVTALLITSLRAFDRNEGTVPVTPSPTERWVSQIPGDMLLTSVASYEGNVYGGGNPSRPGPRGVVTAFDPHGDQLWSARTARTFDPEIYGLAVDGTGVYAGYSYGFTKWDLDGARVWSRQTRASGHYSRDRYVALDGSGVYLYTPMGKLEKDDRDGNLIWSTNFLSSLSPSYIGQGTSMVAAPSGGVYISFEGCPGSVMKGDATCDRRGNRLDFFLLRIDADGNVLWTTRLGAGRDDWIPIVANADGVYALGPAWACGGSRVTPTGRDNRCLLGFDEAGHPTMHVRLAMAASSKAPFASVPAYDVTGVLVVESGSSRGGLAEIHRYDADGNETWVQRVSLGRGYLTAAVANGNGLAIVTEDYRRGRYVSSVASVPLTQMTAGGGSP